MSYPTVDDLVQTANARIRVLLRSDDADDIEERAYLFAVRDQLTTGQGRRRIVERLTELCPCSSDPEADGPEQECPVHGDGVTFVRDVQRLVAVQWHALLLVDGASEAGSSDVMLVDSAAFARLSEALEAES